MEIYLDNAATTKTDPDAAQAALEMMTAYYGNPSSLHAKGLEAQQRVGEARKQVASLLGCDSQEIVFTSGGTEANNMALLGGAGALRRRGRHVVAAASEHASVLSPISYLRENGWETVAVPPLSDGSTAPEAVAVAVTDQTVLVSCMLVNSETGAINKVDRLVQAVRRKNKNCLIHCDGVQAFGKLPVSVKRLGVDLFSVSAHKIHAPKGCGALYIRKGVRILPIAQGGSQERGRRPGTESSPLICAFGHAARKAREELQANLAHTRGICEYFVNNARSFPGLCMNSTGDSTPYIQNISLPGYLSGHLVEYLSRRGIYASGGSACSGGARSHVLLSMGLPDRVIDGALRVSFSKYTTTEEIDVFFRVLAEARDKLIHDTGRKSQS